MIKHSRPRFWIYVLGPYLIWYVASMWWLDALYNPLFWLFLVYFTYPANILIYGINDIFDRETDQLNDKKKDYEELLTPKKHKKLIVRIVLRQLPFLSLALLYGQFGSIAYLLLFWFFGIFYSARPIRAKAIPFIDGIFNILYIIPALVGASLTADPSIQRWVWIAGGLRCIAMHAYSAIPDIQADQKAGIATVATVLGARWTSRYCIFLYVASGILGSIYTGRYWLSVMWILYGVFVYMSFFQDKVFGYYKLFPIINMSMGFLLFCAVIIDRFFS